MQVCDALYFCSPRCESRDVRALDGTKTSDLCSAMCIAENHLCDAMHFHCDLHSHCGNPLRCRPRWEHRSLRVMLRCGELSRHSPELRRRSPRFTKVPVKALFACGWPSAQVKCKFSSLAIPPAIYRSAFWGIAESAPTSAFWGFPKSAPESAPRVPGKLGVPQGVLPGVLFLGKE